jgi:hypothetical protein
MATAAEIKATQISRRLVLCSSTVASDGISAITSTGNHLLQNSFAVHAIVGELGTHCKHRTQSQPSEKTHQAEFQSVRRVGLSRQIGSVYYPEMLALLPFFQVRCHFRLIHLAEKRVVICPRLIVVTGNIRELLFPDWRSSQSILVISQFGSQFLDFVLVILNFDLVRLELAFQLEARRDVLIWL